MPSSEPLSAAIYARVSTLDQNCEMQLTDLREYCARRGWKIVGEYVDRGWSGASANRPELEKLKADAGRRRFDAVLVWKLDRFGRSMVDLLNNIELLKSHGVRWLAITQNLDTDEANPTARLLLGILGLVAEFEREMIRERTLAGQLRYRKQFETGQVGKRAHSHSGKDLPVGRPAKVFDRDRAKRLRREGASIRAIAAELGVGPTTIYEFLAAK